MLACLRSKWKPTQYSRWWVSAQKNDTKARTSTNIRSERNVRSMEEVRLLDAHMVTARRNRFNPILGTGGNVGKRDLAKLWKDACRLARGSGSDAWLKGTLTGEYDQELPDLSSGGTWFVFANKTFNSGQGWYREGRISPWSVLFAMEGALMLIGETSRRLGSRSRPYAAFPFVSDPAQPVAPGEIGLAEAEFWAPLWEAPATLAEIRSLFQRGLARIGGRAAQAPHEFAIAARAVGVDAGVTEFVRYELRQTTSSQVYEAIPRAHVAVPRTRRPPGAGTGRESDAELLVRLVESGWLDRLPYEPRDPKKRGRFKGLRGPVEAAIIRVGEDPGDPGRWGELLLTLARVQARIDRNKTLRDRCAPLPRLSTGWFDRIWPANHSPETIMARSIASIGARSDAPMLVNVYGVQVKDSRYIHFPQSRPQRAVWHSGQPLRALFDVIHRRLLDAAVTDVVPLDATCPCPASLVYAFLDRDEQIQVDRVCAWIPALSLLDWSRSGPGMPSGVMRSPPADGTHLLHSLFKPFFHPRAVQVLGRSTRNCQPRAGLSRSLLHLIQYGHLEEAFQLVRNWYLAVGSDIVLPPPDLATDGERLAAALLMPMQDRDVERGLLRWLQPTKSSID
ncbi:MAG: type I-U CRISPR-associated protein Csx17 [Acidobacteriota bacterium]